MVRKVLLRVSDKEGLDRINYSALSEKLNKIAIKRRYGDAVYTPELCRKLARNMLCINTIAGDKSFPAFRIPVEVETALEYMLTQSPGNEDFIDDADGFEASYTLPRVPIKVHEY